MSLKGTVKLVSQLLDLPIIDKDERWCGIVDDVELEGAAGKEMRVKALLVGPGAYSGRMPTLAVCDRSGDRRRPNGARAGCRDHRDRQRGEARRTAPKRLAFIAPRTRCARGSRDGARCDPAVATSATPR